MKSVSVGTAGVTGEVEIDVNVHLSVIGVFVAMRCLPKHDR